MSNTPTTQIQPALALSIPVDTSRDYAELVMVTAMLESLRKRDNLLAARMQSALLPIVRDCGAKLLPEQLVDASAAIVGIHLPPA